MSERERTVPQQNTAPGAAAPGDRPAAGANAHGDGHAAETQGARAGSAPELSEEQQAAEVQGDLDELVKTAAQRDEYLALAQRTQADFENYRKRVSRETAAAGERGAVALAKELLPALDNLDRAIEHAEHGDPLLEGVRLVRSELAAALARVGIESYAPVGEQFDPALHEAVATAPAPAEGPGSGAVLEVYQHGYRLGELVIRPARVVVAA
jgi:molecular chaperone GrpE